MAAHDALMDTLEALEVDAPCNPVKMYLNKGPNNYKWMARIGYYGWAIRFGSDADRIAAYKLVVDFLDREARFGLFTLGENLTEQFLFDPHRNFDLYPACVGLILAIEAGDEDLAMRFGDHIYSHIQYARLCAFSKKNVVRQPGTRLKKPMPVEKANGVLTIFYREYSGIPHTGNAKDPEDPIWNSYRDHACCRFLRNNLRKIQSYTNQNLLPLYAKILIVNYKYGSTIEFLEMDKNKLPTKELVTAIAVHDNGSLIDSVQQFARPLDVAPLGQRFNSQVFG